MTDTYGPFDAATGDPRQWTQDQWYRHAPKWAQSGVNGTPAASTTTGDLALTLSALTPTIGAGRAWVRGAGFERPSAAALSAIPANTNVSLSRRDRIVLRRDLSAKTVTPTLIQGTASASPTAPAFQQVETGQWDFPLFSFLVPPNSGTTITDVLDERGYLGDGTTDPMFVSMRARDSAMPSPTKGQRCSTADGFLSWLYTGSQWFLTGWQGTDRSSAGLPGISLAYTGAAIANNTSTVIGSWTTVSGPPAVHSGLLAYSGSASIKALVAGRLRVTGYAFSDTAQAGASVLQVTGPTIGAMGTLVDRRHRSSSGGYGGSQTLEQWLDAVLDVQPNDLIGMTVYQNNPAAAAVSYNLNLQAHYL